MTVALVEDAYVFDPDPPLHEVRDLVLAHHYSGRFGNASYVAGLRAESGALVAGIAFANPPTRWSEKVLELCRLVRLPDTKPNLTQLIAKACKEIRKRGLGDLLVSFADSTHAHHGGVYQAASWFFHETRQASHDGFYIDGVFVPRRTCNARWGTSSRTDLPAILDLGGIIATPHFDLGKHLYWRPLTRTGELKAERLKLKKMPYPKPATLADGSDLA